MISINVSLSPLLQVSLLKGCSSEVMMLRGARRYDPQRDSIIYATNYPFSKDNYVKAGLANEALFRFCRNMCKMKVDNAEYALITAIVIFSDREEQQEHEQRALQMCRSQPLIYIVGKQPFFATTGGGQN